MKDNSDNKSCTRNYKYIHMELDRELPKTQTFDVVANSDGGLLGEIKFFPHWRQYCFFPSSDCVFSKGCMDDINHFISLIQKHKKLQFDEDGNGIIPSQQTQD